MDDLSFLVAVGRQNGGAISSHHEAIVDAASDLNDMIAIGLGTPRAKEFEPHRATFLAARESSSRWKEVMEAI